MINNVPGGCLKVTSCRFNNQKYEGAQPVEHVMHIGAGEGSSELLTLASLGESHEDVGDGGADVCAHHERDGLLDGEQLGSDHRDEDGGRGGGRLHEHRHQHADQAARHLVVEHLVVAEDLSRLLAAEQPEAVRQEGERADEEEESIDDQQHLPHHHHHILCFCHSFPIIFCARDLNALSPKF